MIVLVSSVVCAMIDFVNRLREDEIKKKTRATKVTNKFKSKKEPNPVKIALKQIEEHLQVITCSSTQYNSSQFLYLFLIFFNFTVVIIGEGYH